MMWRSWRVEKAGRRYSLRTYCEFYRTWMWICKPSCWFFVLTCAGMVPWTCFDLDHSSQNQVHHLDMVTGAVIADSFDKCNGIVFDTGRAMAYVQVTTDFMWYDESWRTDVHQNRHMCHWRELWQWLGTTHDGVRFDSWPFIFSKLNIHTARSYKFDVEPTTQAFINRCIFAYINVGVPDGVNMNGLRNVCALSVAMMYMWSPLSILHTHTL